MAPSATPDHLSAQNELVERLVSRPDQYALFLDVDGTLIDIAARPDTVVVSDALPALVTGLSQTLAGALALVSGRTVQDLDRLFTPLRSACAGGHGAQLRLAAGGPIISTPLETPLSAALKAEVGALAAQDDRLLFEDKQTSIALHYRGAPERADDLRAAVDALIGRTTGSADAAPDVIAGKMIYEIKAAGFDKGKAVLQFLEQASFSGRSPIMIGDDTTDESAFAQVRKLKGFSLSVGRELSNVDGVLASPRQVRMALAQVLTGAFNRIFS